MALNENKLSQALVLEPLTEPLQEEPTGLLTEKQYWNSTHLSERDQWQAAQEIASQSGKPGPWRRLKRRIKSLLGRRLLERMSSYEDYLLWEVIYNRYMPRQKGARVLEVGSAPGDYLVRVAEKYGFVPYGIEYSESGVALNRQIFAAHNLDPENVIQADFLSPEVHESYRGAFDIVVSRGFIEHFTNVKEIIEKHLNLLADGGHLLVSVPNLCGVNYLLARLFHKEVIALHNLKIMQREEFLKLFDQEKLTPVFCDYYGTFNFGLFNTAPNSSWTPVLNACMKLQLGLNTLFRFLFRERGAESRFFSPSLLYIGIKRKGATSP